MPRQSIELTDGWQFAWTSYAGRDRQPPGPQDLQRMTWRDATVPGNVQTDLHRHGLGDDPFFADNADHYRWCEEVDFWYRRRLDPARLGPDRRAILHFGGLDTFATIWIDGRLVGRHHNMFTPYRVDVTNHLSPDRPSELLIRFGASAFEPDLSAYTPHSWAPVQRTRTRKAQISWGWDIGPRIVTVGPWRPVRLELADRGAILHAGVRTLGLDADKATLEAVLAVEWYDQPADVRLRGNFGPVSIDHPIRLAAGVNDVVIPFELPKPKLWWPNGLGEQHLHDLDIALVGDEKRDLDRRTGRFGVCRLELLQEPRADGGRGFRFTANGRPFFAKGLNWTPCDAMFARATPDRIRELVRLAADAHVNMFRIWGGGVYEDESFWQACDEAGILVWQDFMFACSLYPQDDAFLKLVRGEAECVVRAQRGHVAMAVWSGDNEIDWICGVESGTTISHKVLPEIVSRLDAPRPYIPSSPFSDPGYHPNDPRFGDCHLWNHTVKPDDPFYTAIKPNFVSEIGRISLPAKQTIDSFIPKDKQWPVANSLWHYHATDTNRWGWFRNMPHVLECVKVCGYREPKTLDELIEITQKIQADACRFWIEHFGAQSDCWGLLLWNLCDCWPQVSDAVISYDLAPKSAYHAIKQAYGRLKR